MADATTELDIVQDQSARQNWGNLFNLISRSEEEKTNNKGAIDQIILQLVFNWLEKRDECGAIEDLLDIALYNLAGNTLDGLANQDLDGYLPPNLLASNSSRTTTGAVGAGQTLAANARTRVNNIISSNLPARNQDHNENEEESGRGGGRHLQFFADGVCSTFESTIFLGSMLSFSSCADVDIGRFFGTVEENLVDVMLTCVNSFIQPFSRDRTCASRNFQNYVMDACIAGIVRDDVLGHIFQLFLVSPKQTCGCMSTLAAVPQCRVDLTATVSLDGMMTSKMACLLESQICDKLEGECDRRLRVLDDCLPSLFDINNDNFSCEEVLCRCEQNDKGLLNYPGKAMELPMSDMCTEKAATEDFAGSFISERYAVLQDKCGAKYLHSTDAPTAAPTITAAPQDSNNTVDRLIDGRQVSDSPINSVVSGVLLALAITGIASIFLVFVLALWRKRFRAGGRKVQTVAEMKAKAQEQIRKLEEDVRRMEEQQEQLELEEKSHNDRRTNDPQSPY